MLHEPQHTAKPVRSVTQNLQLIDLRDWVVSELTRGFGPRVRLRGRGGGMSGGAV